jgi:uncharacterized protein (DUF302 family)
MVTVASAHFAAETERRLLEALSGAGLSLAARIDHRANALEAGLDLPPTVLLVFGDPRAGTPLMQQQRTIGLDLPLKVLIWEEMGQARLTYNDPGYLAQRHGVDGSLVALGQIKSALERFTSAATDP